MQFTPNGVLAVAESLPQFSLEMAFQNIKQVMDWKKKVLFTVEKCDPQDALYSWFANLAPNNIGGQLRCVAGITDVTVSTIPIPLSDAWKTVKSMDDMRTLYDQLPYLVVGRSHHDEFRGVGINNNMMLWWPETGWTLRAWKHQVTEGQFYKQGVGSVFFSHYSQLHGVWQKQELRTILYGDFDGEVPGLKSLNELLWLDRKGASPQDPEVQGYIAALTEVAPTTDLLQAMMYVSFPLDYISVDLLGRVVGLHDDEQKALLDNWQYLKTEPIPQNVVFHPPLPLARIAEIGHFADLRPYPDTWQLQKYNVPFETRADALLREVKTMDQGVDAEQLNLITDEMLRVREDLSGNDAHWRALYKAGLAMQDRLKKCS